MLRLVCDRCSAETEIGIVDALAHILPSGWSTFKMEITHTAPETVALCPSCTRDLGVFREPLPTQAKPARTVRVSVDTRSAARPPHNIAVEGLNPTCEWQVDKKGMAFMDFEVPGG